MTPRLAVFAFLCFSALARADVIIRTQVGKGVSKPKKDGEGALLLNGERTEVRWTDGDSFKVKSGKYQGRGTRVSGYNALESFGPVHRWGEWTSRELYEQAKSLKKVAARGEWTCTTDGKADGYGRLLVVCPDLAVALIRDGQVMAYAVEGGEPLPGTLEAQAEAMKAKRGIWAKGHVNGVVTSLHSVGEEGSTEPQAYNRVVDTRTGQALKRAHTKTYAVCEEVCEDTDGERSCMVYVPFERRYKHKPDCLKK
ncbi:MAG: thermonuclease family protein [Myxococcales bacterium]|nr:thermonuclease family protein [Myxococcales bacterium]